MKPPRGFIHGCASFALFIGLFFVLIARVMSSFCALKLLLPAT